MLNEIEFVNFTCKSSFSTCHVFLRFNMLGVTVGMCTT